MLRNADLVEVAVVQDDLGKFKFIPLRDGEIWRLSYYEFDVPVEYVLP
ncbi:MAG: hypothetical protein JSU94_10270 [Phycisphaerales bacterium]|nr:MAG: hypothetical protein JSU94_10270 [Phycisphaerales bacterium]